MRIAEVTAHPCAIGGNAMTFSQVVSVPKSHSPDLRMTHGHRASKLRTTRRHVLAVFALAAALAVPCSARAAPEGQLTWAVHVTLAPTWFDPAETSGIITPYMVLYAVHDAMVKPMPGNSLAPSLAESVTVSDDKLT